MPSAFTLVTETPFSVEALFDISLDISLDIDAHVESMSHSGVRRLMNKRNAHLTSALTLPIAGADSVRPDIHVIVDSDDEQR